MPLRLALAAALVVALLPSTAAALPPGTFRSSVVVGNPGTAAASVSLTFLTPAGASARVERLTVPPGASRIVYVPNMTGLPDGRYSVLSSSDQYVTLVVNLASDDQRTATAYRAAGTTLHLGRTLYLPHGFAEFANLATTIVLSNGGNTTATTYSVSFRQRDGSTVGTATGTLPPLGTATIDTPAVAPGSGIRSAIVSASDDVAATVLTYGTTAGVLGAARGVTGGGAGLAFPIAYKEYVGYTTALIVQNADAEASNLRTTEYDQRGQGVVTHTTTSTAGPGGPTVVAHGAIAELPAGFNGSALSVSPEGRRLVGWGSILHERHYESYEALAGGSTRATCTTILKNYANYNTSLTVQNVGSEPTNLTLRYVDHEGREIVQQSLSALGAGAIYFNYTPSTAELPDGFNGQVAITSSGQPIVAVVNELLGAGGEPGDQLFSYGCDGQTGSGSGSYSSIAPIVLKNAPIG